MFKILSILQKIFKESETLTNFRKEIEPCLIGVVQRFSTDQGSSHYLFDSSPVSNVRDQSGRILLYNKTSDSYTKI